MAILRPYALIQIIVPYLSVRLLYAPTVVHTAAGGAEHFIYEGLGLTDWTATGPRLAIKHDGWACKGMVFTHTL